MERAVLERLEALGPAPHAELLHVLMLPDFDRAARIGSYYGNPKTRTFAELPITARKIEFSAPCVGDAGGDGAGVAT